MNENEHKFYEPGFMNLLKYHLERADLDEKWDLFVQSSEQGTIFSRKAFLEAFPARHGLWYCYKKNTLKAAVAVVETDDGKACKSVGHMIHNGIMFVPEPSEQNLAQSNSNRFAITAFIIQELSKIYKYIDFTNSTAFTDLRPFLWHNYHTDGPKVTYDIRYTSILKLPEYKDIFEGGEFFNCFNTLRRRVIRTGINEGIKTTYSYDLDSFISLFISTFERQNIVVDQNEIDLLYSVISNLHKNNMIRGISAYDANGNLGTILIFGINNNRAYYLYGSSLPDKRSANTGSIAFWDAFKYLAKEGVSEVDLEGINSPKRGYFKLSFGGSIAPYYRVFWNGE